MQVTEFPHVPDMGDAVQPGDDPADREYRGIRVDKVNLPVADQSVDRRNRAVQFGDEACTFTQGERLGLLPPDYRQDLAGNAPGFQLSHEVSVPGQNDMWMDFTPAQAIQQIDKGPGRAIETFIVCDEKDVHRFRKKIEGEDEEWKVRIPKLA